MLVEVIVLCPIIQCNLCCLQLFDGKEGRPKYPRRWVIFPPLL